MRVIDGVMYFPCSGMCGGTVEVPCEPYYVMIRTRTITPEQLKQVFASHYCEACKKFLEGINAPEKTEAP